ncbi:MAG: nucleoside deaminase [Bacteroidales bacterium]|nr:nucleoside deaminase [Bacteroidales bacterium]
MTYPIYSDEYFMNIALQEATKAYEKNEIPIGAIIVLRNKIIAKAYNQTESLQDPTAHAEILSITSANQFLGSKYLKDATIYVTVEPCLMCNGAIFWSKISRLVYGANEQKVGFSKFQEAAKKNNLNICHPKLSITKNILEKEAAELMSKFFKSKR